MGENEGRDRWREMGVLNVKVEKGEGENEMAGIQGAEGICLF